MQAAQTDLEARTEHLAVRLRARGKWVSDDLRVLPEVVADLLCISPDTLTNWRAAKLHPELRWCRPAGRVTYFLADALAAIERSIGDASID